MRSFFELYSKLKDKQINEDAGGMQPAGPMPTMPPNMPPIIAPGNMPNQPAPMDLQPQDMPTEDMPKDNTSAVEGEDAQDPQSMMIKALQDIQNVLEPQNSGETEEGEAPKPALDIDEDRKATISQLAKMGLRILGVGGEDEEDEESESGPETPVGTESPEKPIGDLGDMAGMSNAGTSDMPNQAGVMQPQAE